MKSYLQFWFYLSCLLISLNGLITVVTTPSTISQYCTGSPYWKLNLCNITCLTCSSSSYNDCISCENNYTYTSSSCELSNNSYTFVYLQYFTSASIGTSELALWSNANNDRNLDSSNILHICPTSTSTQSYQFDMIGLWGSNDKVRYTVVFTDKMSQVTVKFNLLLLLNNAQMTIYLGEVNVYNQIFSSVSILNASYYTAVNSTDNPYLSIDSLSSTNVISIIQPIEFDLSFQSSTIELIFEVNVNSVDKFWAISDMSFLFRQCDTCPKQFLLGQISKVALAIVYTAAFLIPGIIILFALIMINNYRKVIKRNKEAEMNASKSNLPLKGIKRVIDAISSISGKKKRNPDDKRKSTESAVGPMVELKRRGESLFNKLMSKPSKVE